MNAPHPDVRPELAAQTLPRIVVFTHVYPNSAQPNYGLFVRERMRRVAAELPLIVVSPVPWFPFQSVLRLFKPHYRPDVPREEEQNGIRIYHPRFLSLPGFCKWTDGWFEALGSYRTMKRLQQEWQFDLIDSHFVYPDGVAARLLARWLKVPYTITLRGSLTRFWSSPRHKRQIDVALRKAARVFSVADSLRQDAIAAGHDPDHIQVVGNGVDLERFRPADQAASRARFNLPAEGKLLVSVGGLTERKGFHRVIACLPELLRDHPDLHFAIAGGASPEGNNRAELEAQIAQLGLQERVHLLGPVSPDELHQVYSAGDVFVLATRFEGWANVFLEASACGLPIVTTRVGGNAEVVSREEIGLLVPYDDHPALVAALQRALSQSWNREAILKHARDNAWQTRIPQLLAAFQRIHAQHRGRRAQ